MFSRVVLSTYCRVLLKPYMKRQLFPQTRLLHVSHRIKDINLRIRYLGPHSPQSAVFNTNFIRFASSAEATQVPAKDALPQIPEPPTPAEPAEIIGEATLQSYGLGGYLPIGLTQHCLYWIHTTCGIPWWATIIVGTAAIKTIMFPLFLKMQKHQALTQIHSKEIAYFERKKKEAMADSDQIRLQSYTLKQEEFYKSHNMMTVSKSAVHYGTQGVIFFTFFMAMNGMARVPIDSMRKGGLFWFSDLSVADPSYLLPIVTAISTALFVHLSPPPTVGVKLEGIKKYFKFIVPIVTFPFLIYFKTAVLLYIITSTWLTFLSQVLVRIPKFRAFCKLPPIIKVDYGSYSSISPSGMTTTLKNTIKDIWGDIKYQRASNAAYLLDQKQFEAAGRGAVTRTYKFNPTKETPKAVRNSK